MTDLHIKFSNLEKFQKLIHYFENFNESRCGEAAPACERSSSAFGACERSSSAFGACERSSSAFGASWCGEAAPACKAISTFSPSCAALHAALCACENVDMIVIGGDVLDSHERVSVVLMNTALKLFKVLSNIAPLYILIGNHDYINNQQFLTINHWMNAIKEWKNIFIVDKPLIFENFLFVPYVFPGKFKKSINEIDLTSVICIFAHQEFLDCQMGIIKSVQGDRWESNMPLVISGHIHDRQKVNSNILYPGSISKGKIFKYFFSNTSLLHEESISLNFMCPNIKKINLTKCDEVALACEIENFENEIDKIIIEGDSNKISFFKKTDFYRTNQNKIKFIINDYEIENNDFETDFKKNLENLVEQENDLDLKKDFLNLFL
jgi:DNA repair exonuclease SbcCD nuclease subunit